MNNGIDIDSAPAGAAVGVVGGGLAFFLPFIFWIILGFGDAEYQDA